MINNRFTHMINNRFTHKINNRLTHRPGAMAELHEKDC